VGFLLSGPHQNLSDSLLPLLASPIKITPLLGAFFPIFLVGIQHFLVYFWAFFGFFRKVAYFTFCCTGNFGGSFL